MLHTLTEYAARRDALLDRIVTTLRADPRFVAAWLTGSFGRGTADAISDLDLNLVVAHDHAPVLCSRESIRSAKTSPERLALIRQFGPPAILRDNHDNAPPEGTFTFITYADSAVMVDWILIPQAHARRPVDSALLFDHAGIPTLPAPQPESREERCARAADSIALFWMIAAVTVKQIVRHNDLQVQVLLAMMWDALRNVERLAAGDPPEYRPRPPHPAHADRTGQIAAVRDLCDRLVAAMPALDPLGCELPPTPLETLEVLFALVTD